MPGCKVYKEKSAKKGCFGQNQPLIVFQSILARWIDSLKVPGYASQAGNLAKKCQAGCWQKSAAIPSAQARTDCESVVSTSELQTNLKFLKLKQCQKCVLLTERVKIRRSADRPPPLIVQYKDSSIIRSHNRGMSEGARSSDLTFKLIRIYVVEYLATVYGYKSFQQEAINVLALYILGVLRRLATSLKRVLSLQGSTTPNCLHLVHALYQGKQADILQLVQFITRQTTSSNKSIQVFCAGLENLGRSLFSQQTEEINQHKVQALYPNIKYIPYVYIQNVEQAPLPIKAPVDQGLKKPAEYTYRNLYDKVEKVQKNVEKLGNYSVREMRRSLGILNIQEEEERKKDGPRKIMAEEREQVSLSKGKFSMINYI